MQGPHPGAFDRQRSRPPIADLADRLVAMHVAAVPRPRCQSEPAADLAAILEVAPERLVYQPARKDLADTLEAFQLAGLCDQRVVSFQSGTLGRLELLDLMFNQHEPFGLASDLRKQRDP